MPLLIGIVLLALGISLAVVAWSPAFVAALQVFAVVTLLFVGLLFSLVGYSAIKAERSCAQALEDDPPGDAEIKAKDSQSAPVES